MADIDMKVHNQVNSSTEGEANETSSNFSDNPPVNFMGYVGSPCEKAGNISDCVASAGAGTSSDGLVLVCRY